jgi:transcriptional regulator with GAF, ATPase, and Fis domain
MSLSIMEAAKVQVNSEDHAHTKVLQVETAMSHSIEALQDGIFSLLRAVESLEATLSTTAARGINFSDEVRRFEINLIKRALLQADGNQTKAALFLSMNKSTLNSMIKRYQITLGDLEGGGADFESIR